MKTLKEGFLLPAGVLAVLGGGVFFSGNLQPPQYQSIRFVDVNEVMYNSKEYQLGLKKIKERISEIRKEVEEEKKKLDQGRSEIRNLKPGTTEYENKILELRLIETRLKYLQEKGSSMFSRDNVKLQNYIYDRIRDAVKTFALGHRLKAVFIIREYKPKGVKDFSIRETQQENVLREVLWHDPQLDISKEIIRMINS